MAANSINIAFYALLFLYLIHRLPFFKIASIKHSWIYIAFAFKTVMALLNYYVWEEVIGHGDMIMYFHDSKIIYNTLWTHPAHYFEMTFGYSFKNTAPDHLQYIEKQCYYFWNKVEYNMVRLNAVLNIFSFGNIFGNILIMSMVSFTGFIGLYKVLSAIYTNKKNLLFTAIFFIPSVVFWSSGILKEGPVLFFMCLLFIQLVKPLPVFSKRSALYFIFILCGIMFFRYYIAVIVLIYLIPYSIAKKYNYNPLKVFAISILFMFSMAVIISYAYTPLNIFEKMEYQQSYFLNTENNTGYHFEKLSGTAADFIMKIPYAFANILFKPNPLHRDSLFRLYAGIEMICLLCFMCICIVYRTKNYLKHHLEMLLMFCICITTLIMYGMIVNDVDTIARYRTMPVFFLSIVFICASKFTDRSKRIL